MVVFLSMPFSTVHSGCRSLHLSISVINNAFYAFIIEYQSPSAAGSLPYTSNYRALPIRIFFYYIRVAIHGNRFSCKPAMPSVHSHEIQQLNSTSSITNDYRSLLLSAIHSNSPPHKQTKLSPRPPFTLETQRRLLPA